MAAVIGSTVIRRPERDQLAVRIANVGNVATSIGKYQINRLKGGRKSEYGDEKESTIRIGISRDRPKGDRSK